jgi:hypothetical protein
MGGLKHQRRSAAMQHYVGLDVSVKETSVCIVDKAGKQTKATVPSVHTGYAHVSPSELCTIETRQEKREFLRRVERCPSGTMDDASPFRVLMPAGSLTARTRREIDPLHPPDPIMGGPKCRFRREARALRVNIPHPDRWSSLKALDTNPLANVILKNAL